MQQANSRMKFCQKSQLCVDSNAKSIKVITANAAGSTKALLGAENIKNVKRTSPG